MINWEVILWTSVTVAVMVGIFGLILSVISAMNMRKRRKEVGDIHTSLTVGSKVIFAGGFVGKIVRIGEEEFIGIEVAPKTIVEVSRYAVQAIVDNK